MLSRAPKLLTDQLLPALECILNRAASLESFGRECAEGLYRVVPQIHAVSVADNSGGSRIVGSLFVKISYTHHESEFQDSVFAVRSASGELAPFLDGKAFVLLVIEYATTHRGPLSTVRLESFPPNQPPDKSLPVLGSTRGYPSGCPSFVAAEQCVASGRIARFACSTHLNTGVMNTAEIADHIMR